MVFPTKDDLPPFPDDLPVQDLLVVDYQRLKAGDKTQEDALWQAGTKWGFWYLKGYDAEAFVEPMLDMGRETLALPFEEKMKYWQGNEGDSFGYKVAGATYTDIDGSTDIAEFINVSKDDALAYPRIVHRGYPFSVNIRMETAVRPFIQACVESSRIMMEVFNDNLGLPRGTLVELHRSEKECISETRCIKVPALPKDHSVALGQHTDFGSLSIVVNQLGGLQVLVPDGSDGTWKYVKPIPGHAICNIGDTLSILSGGVLKSCIHRVVPPPGEQKQYERWSLVYFARPTNDVQLEALSTKSDLVAEAVKYIDISKKSPGMTASQWFTKRQTQYRTDANKGVETYLASGPKLAVGRAA